MSLINNQFPDEMEILLLNALESFNNATMTIVRETGDPVIIIVAVVCSVGLSVCCLCVIRCV